MVCPHTNTTNPQTETLPDSQISPEHQDMLVEEIMEAEVVKAFHDAHELSALGPTGQTTL
jgi:hypothetical protein